jgi:hypothetical protein
MLVHADDSPLRRNRMHDPETVPVKQRVELRPERPKATRLNLHELSVSTN